MKLVTPDRIEAEERVERAKLSPSTPDTVLTGLELHVQNCWQAASNYHRSYIEKRLFNCLRRRKGEYNSDKLSEIRKLKGAETYLKHTGMKCRAAKSWIKDVIIPAGQNPWGIEPTPIPELPKHLTAEIIDMRVQQAMAGFQATGVIPDINAVTKMIASEQEDLKVEYNEEAEKRAKAMEVKISDQLIEGNYADELDAFIDDLVTYPIAILRGNILRMKPVLKWGDGYAPERGEEIGHFDQRISPFDFYPSPGCGDVNRGYICIRDRFSRRDLDEMKGIPGYSVTSIDAVLTEMSNGTLQKLARDNDHERARLESKDPRQDYQSGTSDDTVDGVWFYGSVQGFDLVTWGMNPTEIPDMTKEYDIEAIKIGHHVIRAVLNPDPIGRRPVYVTSYEKQSGSLYGESIPEIMAPIQDSMNATMRAMVDNVGFAAAQQVIVNMSRLHPASSKHANAMWPRKIWFTEDKGFGASQGSPIDFTQPQLIAHHLLRVLEKLERFADDHTGIPSYVMGMNESSAGTDTASGLNMLMNAASKGIRQVIGHVGRDIVKPRIERQYVWNMLFIDDDSIKGDCKVNARGTLAEIMRDHLRQERRQFAQQFLTPDVIFSLIGMKGVARMARGIIEEDLDMQGIVPSEEKIEEQEAQKAQNPEPAEGEAIEQSEIELNASVAALNYAKVEEIENPPAEQPKETQSKEGEE